MRWLLSRAVLAGLFLCVINLPAFAQTSITGIWRYESVVFIAVHDLETGRFDMVWPDTSVLFMEGRVADSTLSGHIITEAPELREECPNNWRSLVAFEGLLTDEGRAIKLSYRLMRIQRENCQEVFGPLDRITLTRIPLESAFRVG